MATIYETNVSQAARELWANDVKPQVMYSSPLLARLDMAKKLTVNGTALKFTVDLFGGESETYGQDYRPGVDTLNGGSNTFLDNASFNWKYFQIPVEYGPEAKFLATGKEAPSGDLVSKIVENAKERARYFMMKNVVYGLPSSTTDADAGFQSVTDALNHYENVATYGGLTRTVYTGAKWWWNGGSLLGKASGGFQDHDTAIPASIANFRKLASAAMRYAPGSKPGDYLCVVPSGIFRDLQVEVEAQLRGNIPGTGLSKFGFNTIAIDGIEVAVDPFLDTNPHGGTAASGTTYTPEWFFLFNLNTWELRFHPSRAMQMTDMTWQGSMPNGLDKWMGRILGMGNLVCTRPLANIWRSYMTSNG